MNWFQKLIEPCFGVESTILDQPIMMFKLKSMAESKPMALPKYPPFDLEQESFGKGPFRIDQVMSTETANEQFDPNMRYVGHGSFGIIYEIVPGEVIKFTKDPREAEIAQIVYNRKYDWVVPVLSPPRQVQYDPPIYRLHMKKLRPLSRDEAILVDFIESNYFEGNGIPSIDDIMEEFSFYLDVDKILYIYNRLRYIFDENEKTLFLTDLHSGNFGWDNNELKVLDIGPDTSYDE